MGRIATEIIEWSLGLSTIPVCYLQLVFSWLRCKEPEAVLAVGAQGSSNEGACSHTEG